MCKRHCENGYYGEGCKQKCSCKKGMTCDYITGVCYNNCPEGWMGEKCDQGKSDSWYLEIDFCSLKIESGKWLNIKMRRYPVVGALYWFTYSKLTHKNSFWYVCLIWLTLMQ